ncbi:MAG: DUF1800 family protein [Phaeodactylibacter sp.]|nr:DUF1800 family protein [Phaeodactylibacter sp.]
MPNGYTAWLCQNSALRERMALFWHGHFACRPIFGSLGAQYINTIRRIILEKRETAQFITRKIYRYFVNENIDEGRVEALSRQFYDSGYEIAPFLRSIFESE